MLMPAAVLVVVVLGALAVDQSVVYLRQRELVAAAEAAANDAAGYGLDPGAFYERDEISLDPARARAAALASLRARGLDDVTLVALEVDGDELVVRLRGEAEYLFGGAIPGGDRRIPITARASAQLQRSGP
jgi:hypothetical protein